MRKWTKPNTMSSKTSIKLKNIIKSGKLNVSEFELENLTGTELSSVLKSRMNDLGISIHLWTITSHIDTIKSLLRGSNDLGVSTFKSPEKVTRKTSSDIGINLIKSDMADKVIKEIQIHYVSGRVEKFTKETQSPSGKPLFVKDESGRIIVNSGQYKGFYIKENTIWTREGKRILDIFTPADWTTFYSWFRNAQDPEYINSISQFRNPDLLDIDLNYLKNITKWIERQRGYGRK